MLNRRTFLKLASVSAIVASGPSILKANALTAETESIANAALAASSENSSCSIGYGGGSYSTGDYSVSTAANDLITPSVRIGAENDSVLLTWTESGTNTSYEVWRSTDPYFNIGDPTGDLLATVETANYTDQNLVTDGSEAYFYMVRSIDSCLQQSDSSNRTGGFSFQIQSGS